MLRICYILNFVLVVFANTNIISHQKAVFILNMLYHKPLEQEERSQVKPPAKGDFLLGKHQQKAKYKL